MVSNCANPACATPLRYLRDGRLFQFEVKALAANGSETASHPGKKTLSRQVWLYWLCGQCSVSMTLQFEGSAGLKVVPLPHTHLQYSAAPQLGF